VPIEWATAKLNVGASLTMLGKLTRSRDRLRQAVAAYDDSTLELTRRRDPLGWARIQNNLGLALVELAAFESAPIPILQRAVATLSDALTERTRERVPESWAATESNLGSAERALAQRLAVPACDALEHHMLAATQMSELQLSNHVMRVAQLVEVDLQGKPPPTRSACPDLPDAIWPAIDRLMGALQKP